MPDTLLEQAKERLYSLAILEVAAARRQEELRSILDELMSEHGYDLDGVADLVGISGHSLRALLDAEHIAEPHERLGISQESVERLLAQ